MNSTDIPSYPTDRASVIARGLTNLRDQQKSIQKDLVQTQEHIARDRARGHTNHLEELLIREANLTDVLRVLAVYIELGEQEQRRFAGQPSLFAETEGAS